jgi:hypothetical protein
MSTKDAVIDMIRRMPDTVTLPEILEAVALGHRAELAQFGSGVDAGHYGIGTVSVIGTVDEKHRLVADLPESVPAGPAKTLVVLATDEELSAAQWSASVGRQWALDWDDPREEKYTLDDREPADGAR